MHHFTPDAILEDEIFISRNLDWECDRIGQLLFEYGEKFIEPALQDGMYSLAMKWYLQMLDSLTVHYIQDEHWIYYLQTVSIHRRMYPDGHRLSGYIRF